MAVAREMPRFQYDPDRGSFKQWLFRILHRRISDHLRKAYHQPAVRGEGLEALEQGRVTPLSASPCTTEDALAAAWEKEWEQAILESAVADVRTRCNPKHFQVFDYCVLQDWPAAKVAATLGLNTAQVYLARHRVSQAVKRAARRINDERSLGRLS